MEDLIIFRGGKALVSSSVLANGFELGQRSIDRLIKTNAETLKNWGEVETSIGGTSNPSNRGGHNKIDYLLNEQQAMLIMTYTRKTQKTDDFRVSLINAFMGLKSSVLNAEGLLNESIRMLEKNKQAGSNWGHLGSKIKQERKPLLETIEAANRLLQIEFKFEGE
jgi:phage regulator Rha-like protein